MQRIKDKLWIGIMILLVVTSIGYAVEPRAPATYWDIETKSPEPTIGAVFNQSGGTLNVINFDVTSQNPRWKGFVGNISGSYVLMDADNFTLYNWTLTTAKGEIYATRKSDIIDWNIISCATEDNISAEMDELGFASTDEDNINKTFYQQDHNDFYAGDSYISEDSCWSTYIYVGGEEQSADFSQLLLWEENLVYTGLIENGTRGYNNASYDYQLIVPDNTDQSQASELYYFYVELI